MTINYARESVIDFTKPFMNLGISILFKVRLLYGSIVRYRSLSKYECGLFCHILVRPKSSCTTTVNFVINIINKALTNPPQIVIIH